MKLWKWTQGRQDGCDYKKFTLWYFKIWKFGFDGYIIKFEANSDLPPHHDVVPNGDHYRFNFLLKGKCTFHCLDGESEFGPNTKWSRTSGTAFFRPDIQEHFLITQTKCTIFSLGFVKFSQ